MVIDTKSQVSTAGLLKEAVGEARALLKVETNLARDELRQDVSAFKVSATVLLLGAQLGVIGLTLLIVAALLEYSLNPVPAAVWIGVSMMIAGSGMGALAYIKRPRAFQEMKRRLDTDLKLIREGLA